MKKKQKNHDDRRTMMMNSDDDDVVIHDDTTTNVIIPKTTLSKQQQQYCSAARVLSRRRRQIYVVLGIPLILSVYHGCQEFRMLQQKLLLLYGESLSSMTQSTTNQSDNNDVDNKRNESMTTTTSIAAETIVAVQARYPNGTLGYVADPTFLRQSLKNWWIQQQQQRHPNDNKDEQPMLSYWSILQHYYPNFVPSTTSSSNNNNATSTATDVVITPELVCNDPPGTGWEGGMGGYQLLTEKIQIAPSTNNDNNTDIRILCILYTHAPQMYSLARAAALIWGIECDGFVAFSNVTIPELGMVELLHDGPESYYNMWQKTRSIWQYVYQHYVHNYTYFHLSGDDVYVIVPNLRHYLSYHHDQYQQQRKSSNNNNNTDRASFNNSHTSSTTTTTTPWLYSGQWIRQKNRPYVGGGPGYTLSQTTLHSYMSSGIWDTCHSTVVASYEDRLLSQCLYQTYHQYYYNTSMREQQQQPTASIDSAPPTEDDEFSFLTDPRDWETGEQLYHDCPPQQVYDGRPAPVNDDTTTTTAQRQLRRRSNFHSRAMAYWETLSHPMAAAAHHYRFNSSNNNNVVTPARSPWVPVTVDDTTTAAAAAVGPKYGLDAAGKYSISFHKIHHPLFQARIHALLYPQICMSSSTLSS